jgi:hypothetical protein
MNPQLSWGFIVSGGGCSGYFKVSGMAAPISSKALRWSAVGRWVPTAPECEIGHRPRAGPVLIEQREQLLPVAAPAIGKPGQFPGLLRRVI